MEMSTMDVVPRALVVEDNPSWQQILSEILSDAGLAVEVTDTLDTAVPILRSTPHRLAVVDLSLSDSDHRNQEGLRVLDAVRLCDPGCATILLTGYATVELAVSVLTEHGAFTCLRKETFNRAQFREWVQRALASAPPASPENETHPAPAAAQAEASQAAPLALIVEDDAGWRSILSELLNDAGYQTRLCACYGEAWGSLRKDKFALAIVDLSLEGAPASSLGRAHPAAQDLEGYRLLASTRAGGIPTIVVSGVGTPGDVERAYAEHGILAYLEKQTFDRRAFLRAVEDARHAPRPSGELDALTDRERQVLDLLAKGMTNKEIAEALVITTNTVKRHLKSIFEKLDIHTRSAAAAKAASQSAAEM
jgi:DNA-binding NarL/FixJ family response regulator